MKRIKRFLAKKVTIVLIFVGVVTAIIGRRAAELAADPSAMKDCWPIVESADGIPIEPAGEQLDPEAPVELAGIALPWVQRGGTINDASCLNRTPIHGIVQVHTEEDVRQALTYAREQGLKVSVAGVRHSMGGQAFARNGVVLDIREFNRIMLNEEAMTVTVQSGATWHQIQNQIHPRFAITAMQSTDIFTVGGSISVNAHGMDHHYGALGNTIRSMRVMLADGSIVRASPDENADLFRHVIGGYGLFGVILEAELDITENAIYEPERELIATGEFPAVFAESIDDSPDIGLFYAHLSTAPQILLQEMVLYRYERTGIPLAEAEVPPLGEPGLVKLRRLVLNASKLGPSWRYLKWWAEKNIEPRLESCTVTRNQAMADGEACLISRNEPMHDSVLYLQNDLKTETDILHEYFIPRGRFLAFVDGMRAVLQAHDANLLNASVRVVHPETNALSYAPEEMFSVVLYLNQTADEAGNAHMQALTADLIELTLEHGGRFFLPYQLYFTPDQLRRAYPEVDAFFAAKRQVDPDGLFTNTFYEKYGQ